MSVDQEIAERPVSATLPAECANWDSGWLPQKWVLKLFGLLSGSYGSRFVGAHNGADVAEMWCQTWGAGLSGYAAEEIKRGLAALTSKHPEWPPALGEFQALCRPRVAPEHRQALPAPRDTKDRSVEIAVASRAVRTTRSEEAMRAFYDHPRSAIACRFVVEGAALRGPQQERWIAHRTAAIAGGYLTDAGAWTGKAS